MGPSWSQFVAYSAKTHYEGYNAAEGGPGHATKRSLRKAHCNQSLRRRVCAGPRACYASGTTCRSQKLRAPARVRTPGDIFARRERTALVAVTRAADSMERVYGLGGRSRSAQVLLWVPCGRTGVRGRRTSGEQQYGKCFAPYAEAMIPPAQLQQRVTDLFHACRSGDCRANNRTCVRHPYTLPPPDDGNRRLTNVCERQTPSLVGMCAGAMRRCMARQRCVSRKFARRGAGSGLGGQRIVASDIWCHCSNPLT